MSYVIVAHWHARAAEREKVESILAELSAATRKEPGNIQFVVNRSRDNQNQYLLYEEYKDEQAFQDHQQTAHFKTLVLERGVPLLERRERFAYDVVS